MESLDLDILLWINGLGAEYPFLDHGMLFLSSRWFAIPLYAFLAFSLWKNYGSSKFVGIVLAVVGLVVLTDQGSVILFKEFFQRLRPCHEPDLVQLLRLVNGKCGGQFGFISSHAANTFGLASFVFLLLHSRSRWYAGLFFWAGMVALSRVYLGVHYPSDVLVGAFFGAALGFITGYFCRMWTIRP